MARRLGSTPFADLLPGSLSGDATVRAAAEALDSVLDATTRTIPTPVWPMTRASSSRWPCCPRWPD